MKSKPKNPDKLSRRAIRSAASSHLGVVNHTYNIGRARQSFRAHHFNADASQHLSLPAHDGAIRGTALNVRLDDDLWLKIVPPRPQPEWVTVNDCPFDNSPGREEADDFQEELLSLLWSLSNSHTATAECSISL